eukprot:COSAG05_NODE_1994_length_3729_cov_6.074105_4_plen_63_part_01
MNPCNGMVSPPVPKTPGNHNTDIHTDLCVALSKPGLSNSEKWSVYNKICLQNPDISAGEKKQF